MRGHISHRTVAECRDDIGVSTYFGMEHPQGSTDAGKAQCLPLSRVPPMTKVSDSECEAELDSFGNRLGSASRLAVYRTRMALFFSNIQ